MLVALAAALAGGCRHSRQDTARTNLGDAQMNREVADAKAPAPNDGGPSKVFATSLSGEQLDFLDHLIVKRRAATGPECEQLCAPAGGRCVARHDGFICVIRCEKDADCPELMKCKCDDRTRCSSWFVIEQAPRIANVCVERSPL
ncbi:MAG TPA: hypothetical protein VN962_11615 [Polyangia bacterium]|nr:hypothetical protein [Polyangia bacterium]